MAALATAADLAARLGVTFSTEEAERADTLLDLASGLVREAAGQTIDLTADDVLTRRGTNDDRILLPGRPVVEVSSVTLDGDTVEGWYLDGNALVRGFTLDGTLNYCGGFGWPSQTLVITYTHGYAADAVPATVKSVVLEAAVRVWVNPGSVLGESHGGEQVQYGNAEQAGLLLTDAEEKKLRRFFGRSGGGVWQS